ncbi:MAG TPA: hypothetical protein ENN50_01080 [Prosthecochloris aestuarii]|uniref:VWFA domain-containing protein n=1 Tax=Prosthecochloris aestuarii TaxID=1102 RepID=A0A831SR23_PROAE|nr:hypothetical protein [Prosthecochloris aestuarii]
MMMKKLFLPLVVAMCALPAPAALAASSAADSNCLDPGIMQDEALRGAMEEYWIRYENLRPVDGWCPSDTRLVQLALLLDTSNSMDGLINQAKSQLWRIVNELSRMHKRGGDIRLQVALYEYGNNALSPSSGFIRQVTPFTEDLDRISEALFSLDTNGGSEYCGHVIGSSLNRLRWNRSDEGLKLIYIAGNEPFNQGPVSYEVACRWASERDIAVNTIYCGDYRVGIDTFWQRGADVGGGSYFAIDSDRVTRGIATPYDDDLLMLDKRMNATYVPYGKQGQERLARQAEQDANAARLSAPIAAERAVSKVSKLYQASDWDLVDAVGQEKLSVDTLDKQYLPDELQGMSAAELSGYIDRKQKEREELKQQIAELSLKREAYIQEQEEKAADDESLGSAILKNLRDQAGARQFDIK